MLVVHQVSMYSVALFALLFVMIFRNAQFVIARCCKCLSHSVIQKRAVSCCETARFAFQNGPFCIPVRAVLPAETAMDAVLSGVCKITLLFSQASVLALCGVFSV